MNKLNWKEIQKLLGARSFRERAVLLAAALALIFYVWLIFVFDVINASQAEADRQISNAVALLNNEINRNQTIRSTYTNDPNAFAISRRNELQASVSELDAELLNLYGELTLPSQMANILSDILQRETTLHLVSLENLAPEALFGSEAGADVQVYRHGLSLQLEGEYLETIRFLKQVEDLDVNFFWENLTYQVNEYPEGVINLNIFTLSTQRGFIGV